MNKEIKEVNGAEENITGKCPGCEVNDELEPHICPYKYEINDDEESLCTCCLSCMDECSMSI